MSLPVGTAVQAIQIPREIVNADSVYVVAWRVENGGKTEAGAGVCDIETSKAVVTLEAEYAGYVRRVARVGDEIPVGGLVGYITAHADTPLPTSAATVAPSTVPPGGADRISAKARRKIEELGLDPALFVGHGPVREQDVLALAEKLRQSGAAADDARGAFTVEPLGPIQRRVARVMESVSPVPVSYLERAIDLAPARARARALAAESASVVTELDVLVSALASAARRHPRFNATLTSAQELRIYQRVNVGVAVDVTGDLFVVVLRDADGKELSVIARELRGLQYVAQRRRATAEQLSGGTVTVTSMLGRGIQRFAPIIYPEQTAILGIGDPMPGSTIATLVLGFDHRAANGSDAAAFLGDIAVGFAAP